MPMKVVSIICRERRKIKNNIYDKKRKNNKYNWLNLRNKPGKGQDFEAWDNGAAFLQLYPNHSSALNESNYGK